LLDVHDAEYRGMETLLLDITCGVFIMSGIMMLVKHFKIVV